MKAQHIQHILWVIILMVAGCRENQPAPSLQKIQPAKKSLVTVHKLDFVTRQYEKSEGDCQNPDSLCVSITIAFPEIQSGVEPQIAGRINQAIQQMILATSFSDSAVHSVPGMVEQFIREFHRVRDSDPEYDISWDTEKEVTVFYQDDQVLSVKLTDNIYTGGAHPNTAVRFANFALADGRQLQLDDLLKAGSREALREIAEQKFRRIKNLGPRDSLNKIGYSFEEDAFTLSRNFAIGDSFLLFYYNNYEIAPYAMGPTELPVSFRELAPVINPAGILGRQISRH